MGSHLKKQHSGQHAIFIRDSALCLLPSIVGTVWSHICKSRPPNGGADERPRKPLKVRKANPWRSERPDGQNHLHTRSRPLVDSLFAVDFLAAKLFLLPLDNQVRATPATAFLRCRHTSFAKVVLMDASENRTFYPEWASAPFPIRLNQT